MPRKGAEPGPLVILNNALAGRSLLVTDCCADGRIRNGRPLTSNLTNDLTKNNLNPQNHLQVPKSVLWSLELSRGPGSKGIFLPRTLITSRHRFVFTTNAKVSHLTLLMSHTEFAKWGVFPFHELQFKK